MTQFAFSLVALFGVPAAIVALIFLGHRLTPATIWYSRPVQAVAILGFLSCIGLPILLVNLDSQGDYFEDEVALVSAAFGLPEGARVDRQRDKTLRLGDCWRNAVLWRSDVAFASAASFDRWYAGGAYREAIFAQVADYFGQPPEAISVAPDALDLAPRDPRHVLSDERGSYQRNTRILRFDEPFVCTAIDRAADGSIALRRCDPIAEGGNGGTAGQVILNPDAKTRRVEGLIYYAQGPSTCTNPVRRAVNAALGLPHPEGGKPNTQMGSVLPIQ
ncbi:hypothetical protein [Porphyrobacter sp. YT40]|uniref:hypothetical protein n=1 Tax=Porphyrobacter sp. YT40 TaxID=2547601 RepID=UPI0011426774|nr:hypothetical protein [Porphyrobacter sp. YT40]QDH35454.1 hypothetical protein E2E27_14705 [Porphyrobacter sp. YT40]